MQLKHNVLNVTCVPNAQVWDTVKRWMRCLVPVTGMERKDTMKELSSNVSFALRLQALLTISMSLEGATICSQ